MPNAYFNYFASLDEHALRFIRAQAEHRTAKAEQVGAPAPTDCQNGKVSGPTPDELKAIAEHAIPARFPLATPPRLLTGWHPISWPLKDLR